MISLIAAVALSVVSTSSSRGRTAVELPQQLESGDQYYSGSLTGFRHYLTDTRGTDPELYTLLAPSLAKLEKQERNALVFFGVGVVSGLVTTGIGTLIFFSATNQPLGSDRSDIGVGLGVAFGGVAVALASALASNFMMPSRTQFLNLINHHNRLRPEKPLRLQLGFLPATRGPGGVVFASARF